MPRGRQLPSETDPAGFSKQELMDAGKISPTTFDMIRKAARVRGPSHGGRNWIFSPADVLAMIHRAESGRFSERGLPAAAGWRALMSERDAPADQAPPDP